MKRVFSLAVVFAVAALIGNCELQAQGRGGRGGGGMMGGGGMHGGGMHGGGGMMGGGYGHRGRPGLGVIGGFNNFGNWIGWDFYNPYSFDRPAFPPYFALHPPVHYSDQIVRRPMGISPYAAPAGVLPAEMTINAAPTVPQVVKNPHFEKQAKPVLAGRLDTDT